MSEARMRGTLAWVMAACVVFGAGLGRAQSVSLRLIPFQARLTDASGTALNGVYNVKFVIYDASTGGTAQWVETHPNTSIVGGQLSVFLGSIRSLDDANDDNNPNDAVDFGANAATKFVGITIGTGAEMVPRHQLVPAFHARNADVASSVRDGAITTVMLAPGAVTTDKILDGSIGPADLQAAPFITGANITPASIDSTAITDSSLSLADASPALLNWLMPPGTVVAYAGSTAPAGFKLCDGSPLLRTAYPDLFAAIGLSHGDGSTVPGGGASGFIETHFNLPDYRGRFLRGRDAGFGRDPDAGARLASATGGAAGDQVGTTQSDAMQGHQHSSNLQDVADLNVLGSIDFNAGGRLRKTFAIGDPTQDTHGNGIPRTSKESRPANVSVNFIIKCGRNDAC